MIFQQKPQVVLCTADKTVMNFYSYQTQLLCDLRDVIQHEIIGLVVDFMRGDALAVQY